MKSFILATGISFLALLVTAPSSLAEPIGSVIDPISPLAPSPLIISAYYMDGANLGFVQVHNTTEQLVSLDGWSVVLQADPAETIESPTLGVEVVIAKLSGNIIPRGHIVIAETDLIEGSDLSYETPGSTEELLASLPQKSLIVLPPEDSVIESHVRTVSEYSVPSWVQWKRSTSSTKAYLTSFNVTPISDGPISLEGGGLYEPARTASGLRIVEILPNARVCPPFDSSGDCSDYIKLYNPTDRPVDLGLYRVRTDSGGQSSSSSNTFLLNGELQARSYLTIALRDNGNPLTLTNTGGYVWIEDVHGIMAYPEVSSYPDASSAATKGYSWALDEATGEWKWMLPRPNQANYWPPIVQVVGPEVKNATLPDCGPGRERNPSTNRCRLVTATTSTYTACQAGQERNPATNRCRSVLSATTSLKPCGANQYRNPETNRCKTIAPASSTLSPCPTGQERNPATNRCRKTSIATSSSIPTVTDIEATPAQNMRGWYIAGAAVIGMVGYGIYEWRNDIRLKLRNHKWLSRK